MNESKLDQLLLDILSDIDLDISCLELERIELKLNSFKNLIQKAYMTGQCHAFDEVYALIEKAIENKKDN
jgi:hypothetical protein